MKLSSAAKKAIMIGSMCSISYLAVYVARNILGVATPQMVESGQFTNESIGNLSSIYFVVYALGQLINGRIGDKFKSKYMISIGLVMAGICNMIFSVFSDHLLVSYISYGATGYFLSMIYGPMTKTVAENTEPIYATRCSLGYTFASFFATPLAGVLAAFLLWYLVFAVSSVLLITMGVIAFIVFTIFEKKGLIEYGKYTNANKPFDFKVLVKQQIIKFTFIAILTGIVRTSVVFWLPTYLSQYLMFPTDQAALIFTVISFIFSFNTFIVIFVYERLKRNLELCVLIFFSISAANFLLVYLLKAPVPNIIFMVLAIMGSNGACSMLYSRYCPSLRDTGMVSSATGFLDFTSYMGASISSAFFANAATTWGWGNLILVWLGLMIFGVIVAIPRKGQERIAAP